MRIVTATPKELDLLVPLFEAYRAFYEIASDTAKARVYLRERLVRGDATVFLALQGRQAAGKSSTNRTRTDTFAFTDDLGVLVPVEAELQQFRFHKDQKVIWRRGRFSVKMSIKQIG